MSALTVGELSTKYDLRPQIINAWVVKGGLPVVPGVSPRKIDEDVFLEWRAQHDSAPRKTGGGRPARDDAESAQAIIHQMTQEQKNLFAWCRGQGRGWALATLNKEKQPSNPTDYIELLNTKNAVVPSKISSLIKEAQEGKLFFMDPSEVLFFLVAQLSEVPQTEILCDLIDTLKQATRQAAQWREERGTVIDGTELLANSFVKVEKENDEDEDSE